MVPRETIVQSGDIRVATSLVDYSELRILFSFKLLKMNLADRDCGELRAASTFFHGSRHGSIAQRTQGCEPLPRDEPRARAASRG